MGAIQHVIQILDVQVNLEAGLIVAGNHHRSFGVHNRGPGQAALDGLKHHGRVNTGFLRQG